jgi:hypothetical protein
MDSINNDSVWIENRPENSGTDEIRDPVTISEWIQSAVATSRRLFQNHLPKALSQNNEPNHHRNPMNPSTTPLPLRPLFAATVLALLVAMPTEVNAVNALKIDLTAGNNLSTVDRTWTYNLGPTGMRGWIDNGWPETPAQDGYTAFAPYQILVTTVAAGTPAAGVLATNDVILGASAGTGAVPLFTSDARKSLGWAIGSAEASNGILKFKRWRAGLTTDVSITLPVMGAYSDTAPYNCPKSALVMANAASSLKRKIDANGWGGDDGSGAISALALLATGDSAYLPMLQAYARKLAPPDFVGGGSAWNCYNALFLAEYYMLTGDTQVFHGLSEYVIYAATHSSMFGTAGHGFSNVPPPGGWVAGGTHGSMGWYGPVNQAGLVAQLSIVLGKKAGVVSPEIDPAIARAAKFFSYYVNRGSIPYGEHQPYYGEHQLQGQSRTYYDHCSNGKDALAAVMFACMGDKPVAAEYFVRMSVAGFRGEQYGHTGQGFSYLWTALGANMGGPTAAAEYEKKLCWDRDMKRRSDGSFVYEGGEQWAPGQGSSYWDDSYTYWNYPTAYYLLHAAMPLKKLYITGKGLNPANALSAQTVSNAIWASDFTSLCASYTKAQLIAALGEWDPIVRYNAATELGTRSLTTTEVNSLITMAENPADANQREGACTALGCLKSTSAVPALTRRLKDSNIWVRAKAAKALGQVNASSVAASVPDMLDAFVTNVTPTYPFEAGFNWNDPLQIANGYLSETLFNKLGNITINANKNLLYPAVKAGIKQPAGMWRGMLDGFVQDRLTLPDVEVLIQELIEDAKTEGPADRMFTVTPPAAAMKVLTKYRIAEGIQVCFDNVAYWGGVKGDEAIKGLPVYGEAARWTLPDLQTDLSSWVHDNNYDALLSTVTSLEAATTSPVLVYALPVATPQILATPVNTAKGIALTGSSRRTNPVVYAVAIPPVHGSLTGTPPNLTYTPASGYQGMDSFTFTVTDTLTTSSPAKVQLAVGMGGSGLTGKYYNNIDFTAFLASRVDAAVNFDWGSSPPNGLSAGTYSVRWTGQVLAPETGTYRFSTRTSDGARLWVNGVQVISDWNNQAANIWNDSAAITLSAGQKYNLKLEYFNNTNPATARLYWYMPSRSSQAAMIIPQDVLFPLAGVTLTSPLDGARIGLRAGLPSAVTLTADTSDLAATVTNVSFYNGDALIGSDSSAPYAFVWQNVAAGEYRITAKATDSTGQVTTSGVATMTVDGYTVPVTAGLACHFDAAVGITTDASGVVQGWQDRSGNAHHASLGSGAPTLATNQIMSLPAVQFRGDYLNCAGTLFSKEQYVVVRSPNPAAWGYGAFFGRATGRGSNVMMAQDAPTFWNDQAPDAVTKNGTAITRSASPLNGNYCYNIAPIDNFMILKIKVNDGNTSDTAYRIANADGNILRCDIAEIIGYTTALSASDEALVGGYLTAKYGLTTAYPATGSLANKAANAITPTSAALNATLKCNGNNYDVVAYWGPVNGGMNPANWANSAAVGSWSNVASININRTLTNLVLGTTYYYTFRASNATHTVWAAAPMSFTTSSSVDPPIATTTALATSASTTYGQTATFTATVSPVPPGGTVQFYADGNPLGSPVDVSTSSGAASTSTTLLTVATHAITANYSGVDVYVASIGSSTQTVNQAVLTASADNKVRDLGYANPTFTFQITGYKNGENASSAGVSGAAVLSCLANPSSAVGSYAITATVGSLTAANYSFTAANGILTVMTPASTIPVANRSFETHGTLNAATYWWSLGSPWVGGTTPGPYEELQVNQFNTFTAAADGLYAANLESFLVSVTQNLSTTVQAGDTLSMTFSGGRDKSTGGGKFTATFKVGTTEYTSPVIDTTLQAPNTWQSYTFTTPITNAGNLSIKFSNVSGRPWLDNVSNVTLQAGAGSGSYASWATTNGVTGAVNADSNQDGVPNGIAYFMNATGRATLPGVVGSTVTWTNGGNIPSSAYGSRFVVQTSSDLVTWTPVSVTDPKLSNTVGSVSYTLPPDVGKTFVRLSVTPD